ncbi:MAG TPA: histidine kinase [Novosphingobium sp.]|nr:histidine kinase [Novosphingobium sp.]
MRGFVGAAMIAAGLMAAGTAHAQGWGVYGGAGAPPPPPYGARWQGDDGARTMDFICSGRRAHMLEQRLGHEVEEGDIDPETADRMHAVIDQTEDRQRRECAEGDYRSVRELGWRYDRIGHWIDGAAHGQGWRPRW